jgi:hypothetical protein
MTTLDARRRDRLNQLYTALRQFGIGDRFELAPLFAEDTLPPTAVVCAHLRRNAEGLPPGITADYLATFLLTEITPSDAVAHHESAESAPAPATRPLTAADGEEFDAILTGKTASKQHADRYQNHVRRLLVGLFAGSLVDDRKEVKQSSVGRIDLVFRNDATTGFFERVPRLTSARGLYVPVECKNEEGDPKPAAYQQLHTRMHMGYSTLGLLACRRVRNEKVALARCAAIRNKGDWIMVLTDADFRAMLDAHIAGDAPRVDAPLFTWHHKLAHA